jgi:hypothetical protein
MRVQAAGVTLARQRPRGENDVQPARLARPSGVGPPWAKSRSSIVCKHRDRCPACDLRDAADVAGGDEIGRVCTIFAILRSQPQGSDLAGALKSYEDSLAIRERKPNPTPGNAGWQCDLSVSYNKIGGVQEAHGDLAGALKSYSDSLASETASRNPTPAMRNGGAISQ